MNRLLKIILEEIEHKTPIGKGKEHVVYDYKKDPTKIIKVAWDSENGNKYDSKSKKIVVDLDPEHINMFIRFPKLFAKVFKRTNRYTIIEKLNTKPVGDEETILINQIKKYNLPDLEYCNSFSDLYWSITHRKNVVNNILKAFNKNNEDLRLFDKYINFFLGINKSVGKYVNNVDAGSYNMGYDVAGNLKLLDF